MKNSIFFIYLLILAGTTYLIRVIPFTAIKEKINNRFIRSFLYYIPYAVLTAMTIPAIFYATSWWIGAAAGLLTAVIFALKGKGLTTVAIASCVAVFLVELKLCIFYNLIGSVKFTYSLLYMCITSYRYADS